MADTLQIARESYGRCTLAKTFFEDLSESLYGSTPDAAAMFAPGDGQNQQDSLREFIAFMLLYNAGDENGKLAIDRIGERHNQKNADIRPELYRFWSQSLLTNIEKHDPRFHSDVRSAWEEVINRTVSRLTELYEAS